MPEEIDYSDQISPDRSEIPSRVYPHKVHICYNATSEIKDY